MLKYLVLFFIINLLYAQTVFHRDIEFKKADDSLSVMHNTLDLNKTPKPLTLKQKLRKKDFDVSLAIQEEFYEDKDNIYVQEFNPLLRVNYLHVWKSYLGVNLEFSTSSNSIFSRQGLYLSTGLKRDFSASLFSNVGQKVNYSNQIDSGYFFGEYGFELKGKYNKYYSTVRMYKTIATLSETGVYFDVGYQFTNFSLGFYSSEEYLSPFNKQNFREGQKSFQNGIKFSFTY